MSDGLVRLVWNVDPRGYEIIRRDVLRHRHPVSMRHPNGELQEIGYWELMGVDALGKIQRDDDEFIVPLSHPLSGRTRKEYRVGLLEKEIFRHLINSERQPGNKSVLAFVNTWGLLTHHLVTPLEIFLRLRNCIVRASSRVGERTHLANVRGHRNEWVVPLLEEVSRSGNYPIWSNLEEHSILRPGPGLGVFGLLHASFDTRKRALYFQADTLFQFCALELLYAYHAAIDVTACHACGFLLPLHKSGRRKKYCDDACKMANFRAKHGEALNRVRRRDRAKRRGAAK
jgi:hypothetical protein